MIRALKRVLTLTRSLSWVVARRAAAPGEGERLRRERDSAMEARRWSDALQAQERLVELATGLGRGREVEWLAVIHYERGREEFARSNPAAAATQFRSALRVDRHFVPATVALGEALDASGERREAIRTWERAAEADPSLAVLARLERAYRDEGRPSRMIAVYRAACERAPDDLALAIELGRVYFDLEMLDEAADQFEKIEVRAPDLPAVHAFLGAVFERRGETADAFAEYRRALRLGGAFAVSHRCRACGASAPRWQDRCPSCRRWNTMHATLET